LLLAFVVGYLSCRFFEDVMRKRADNPNVLMETMHLKPYFDEGSRQAAEAADALLESRHAKTASQAGFRGSIRDTMARSRQEKSTKLERDEAVHAALLKRKVRANTTSVLLETRDTLKPPNHHFY
jgi:hypothetical protein